MKYDAHKLPIRSSSAGDQIETRPLYIEEWLDSLPYVDIKKTSQLLFEATRATNEQKSLKSTIRLQLVELYNRPYKYYIDSQIRAGAQHTLQSIETMQQQIEVLKKIAINLGKACKIAADESMKKKTLWKQTKPPLHSLNLSFNYLSHALIFSYLEYSPTPKGVWQELNFIYDFAESLGQENTTLSIPKGSEKRILATIALAYKRIVLASLADPYHLPFGAIWEIYEQLFTWAELSTIGKFSTPSEPASHFIMNLNSDTSPIPYSKFNAAKAKEKHRLLDASKITNLVQTNLSMINKGTSLDDKVILSPYFAKLILGHMSRSWGLPAKRLNQRKEKEGVVSMTWG